MRSGRPTGVEQGGLESPSGTVWATLSATPGESTPADPARLYYARAVAEDEAGHLAEAAALYRSAAELGHLDAMFDLGRTVGAGSPRTRPR